MSFHRRKSKTGASSIKYKWIPLDVDASQAGHSCEAGTRENVPKRGKESGLLHKGTSVEDTQVLLSTTELASAIGSIWKVVGHPSAVCRSRGVRKREEGEGLCCVGSGGGSDIGSGCLKTTAKSNYEELRAIKKMLFCDSSWFRLHLNNYPLLEGNVEDGFSFVASTMSRERILLENKGECCDLVNICGTLNARFFSSLRCMVDRNWNIKDKDRTRSASRNKTCQAELFAGGKGIKNGVTSADCRRDVSCKEAVNLVRDVKVHQRSPCSSDSVESATNRGASITVSSKLESPSLLPSTGLLIGDSQKPIDSCVESSEKQSISEDNVDILTSKALPLDSALDSEHLSNPLLPIQDRLGIDFGRETYALAGALSGAFVSICLHPVDTVKTVIQSRSMNQMSICQAFASVISERGLMGLYRGIASNLASSAPTSAIYTFTYETVKSAMLPILPKEYHSLAHCTAGGCASIATSFIFTPSDRIKQQMQVRSHYQNCWNALVGILEKGGLQSLYAGWGAVLCRNVPHSVIKFYTYESLKKLLLPPSQPDAHLNALQTLFCGGLAGSTAALFTTPFDVVKTRLQTEVPGSLTQYGGVFHTLQQIARHEGLRGLYRGLTPRLAMYVSQGAIFFASYEFFKTVLSLDVSDSPAKVNDNEIKIEDDG